MSKTTTSAPPSHVLLLGGAAAAALTSLAYYANRAEPVPLTSPTVGTKPTPGQVPSATVPSSSSSSSSSESVSLTLQMQQDALLRIKTVGTIYGIAMFRSIETFTDTYYNRVALLDTLKSFILLMTLGLTEGFTFKFDTESLLLNDSSSFSLIVFVSKCLFDLQVKSLINL